MCLALAGVDAPRAVFLACLHAHDARQVDAIVSVFGSLVRQWVHMSVYRGLVCA